MTQRELSKYFYLSLEIKQLDEKLKELDDSAIGSPDYSGMPKAHNNNTSVEERITILKEEIEKKINYRRIKSLEEKAKIIDYINEIEDVEIRDIFRYRYLEFWRWDKIADKVHMSERTVYRKHKKQLTKE